MSKAFVLDLAERVVFSFLGAAIATLAAAGVDLTHLSAWQSAGVAGLAAAVSLIKGVLAQYVGDRDSASAVK
jgi:hypothetical protein